jgi:hypothetical protein
MQGFIPPPQQGGFNLNMGGGEDMALYLALLDYLNRQSAAESRQKLDERLVNLQVGREERIGGLEERQTKLAEAASLRQDAREKRDARMEAGFLAIKKSMTDLAKSNFEHREMLDFLTSAERRTRGIPGKSKVRANRAFSEVQTKMARDLASGGSKPGIRNIVGDVLNLDRIGDTKAQEALRELPTRVDRFINSLDTDWEKFGAAQELLKGFKLYPIEGEYYGQLNDVLATKLGGLKKIIVEGNIQQERLARDWENASFEFESKQMNTVYDAVSKVQSEDAPFKTVTDALSEVEKMEFIPPPDTPAGFPTSVLGKETKVDSFVDAGRGDRARTTGETFGILGDIIPASVGLAEAAAGSLTGFEEKTLPSERRLSYSKLLGPTAKDMEAMLREGVVPPSPQFPIMDILTSMFSLGAPSPMGPPPGSLLPEVGVPSFLQPNRMGPGSPIPFLNFIPDEEDIAGGF